MAPRFVDHDGHCVGKVQAATSRAHRQPQALFRRELSQKRRWQPARLGTKKESIAIAEGRGIEARMPAGGDREHPVRPHRFPPLVEAVILLHPGQLVIIEPGAARRGTVQLEAERMDQVQCYAGIGRQTNDIARVRRDLRFIEDDVKHD